MISIIIPVYNGEKYVTRCISQLLEQKSNDEFEIIFVDDGSTDRTLQIIQKYQQQSNTIKVLRQNHRGVSVARNYGIDNAKGEWIVFYDVDDTIKENYILDIEQTTQGNPDTDIFIFARHYVEANSRVIKNTDISKKELISVIFTERTDTVLGKDYFILPVWGKAYRTSFIKENKLYFIENIHFGEDLLFQLDALVATTRIEFVNRGYYKYEQNSDSVVHRARKDDTLGAIILQKHIESLANNYFDDELKIDAQKHIYRTWRETISSDIAGWMSEDSFRDSLKRLYSIQSGPEYKRTIENCKKMKGHLSRKERVILLIIQHVQPVYILILRYKHRHD